MCAGASPTVAVVVAWVAVAVLTTLVAGSVGRHYATNFTLPGTESQRASDLLKREFTAQSGDVDTIVFHVSQRHDRLAGGARARSRRCWRGSASSRTSSGVDQPVRARRAQSQVSRDRKTAFATINYDKRANLLPNDTGTPRAQRRSTRCTCPGCRSPRAAR